MAGFCTRKIYVPVIGCFRWYSLKILYILRRILFFNGFDFEIFFPTTTAILKGVFGVWISIAIDE